MFSKASLLIVCGAFFCLPAVLAVPTVDLSLNVTESDIQARTGPERVTCYNKGTKIDRVWATTAIDNFCREFMGHNFPNGQLFEKRYTFGNEIGQHMLISGQAINGCHFTVDGNCNRLLRKPIDECNTGGVNGKQGGYVTDDCGQWRSDPGVWQTDCRTCRQTFFNSLSRPCYTLPPGAIESCLGVATINAQKACQDNGNCCLNSGLGKFHDNCRIPFNDY